MKSVKTSSEERLSNAFSNSQSANLGFQPLKFGGA